MPPHRPIRTRGSEDEPRPFRSGHHLGIGGAGVCCAAGVAVVEGEELQADMLGMPVRAPQFGVGEGEGAGAGFGVQQGQGALYDRPVAVPRAQEETATLPRKVAVVVLLEGTQHSGGQVHGRGG